MNVTPKFFGFGFTDFDSNALQHLNLQNVLGGGVGFHAVKTMNTTFDLSGGASYNQEYFSAYSLPNLAPPAPELKSLCGGDSEKRRDRGRRRTGHENQWPRPPFPRISPCIPESPGPAATASRSISSASTKLNNWLGWQITFGDNYLSKPSLWNQGQ